MLQVVPSPPDWKIDWSQVESIVEYWPEMSRTAQDPHVHAEGDVWTHVRMVCEAMAASPKWRELDERNRAETFIAALLHDIGKPFCTRNESGRITSRGHSKRGEILSRVLLWEMALPIRMRERITAHIRFHQAPFYLLERADSPRNLFEISMSARCRNLAVLAEADALGRLCGDRRRILDSVALFEEYAREQECLDGPRLFPSDHSRFLYFRNEGRDPDYLAWDDTKCEVVVMSGLPGSGKDWWIDNNLPGWPVVSLDALRAEMDTSPTENQGRVISAARERAREHLRRGESFVWNTTGLSRQLRGKSIGLFADYNARVRIVYVESPASELFRRNRSREDAVPEPAVRKMMERWEVPDLTEAHSVEWVVS